MKSDRLSDDRLDVVLKALASRQRRAIMRLLLENSARGPACCGNQEVCACKLSDRLGLAESTISHHMGVLKNAGLVTARKDGTWVYYSVQRNVLRQAAEAIEGM